MAARARPIPVAVAIALGLVALAVGASTLDPVLIPLMGVLVVAAGLLLSPRWTAALGSLASVLALVLIPAQEGPDAAIRAAVVISISVLAVLMSWLLARRVQRIEALLAREAAVLSSVPDAVVVLDSDGRIEQLNAALERLVPGARQGVALHGLLHHELGDGQPCPGGCALAGRLEAEWSADEHDAGSIAPAGRLLPIEYSVESQGEIDQRTIVLTVRDVSDRVTADADRRSLIEEAARLAERGELLRAMSPARLAPTAGIEFDVWTTTAPESGSQLLDVHELPDGGVMILLVGAPGDPLAAAQDAWRVMYVARAHLFAGVPMADLVERTASTFVGEPEPPAASLIVAVIDPDTGLTTMVSGGHAPPLLVRRAGSADWVNTIGQGVGSPHAGSANLVTSALEVGDSLVLFDGGTLDAADPLAGMSALRAAAVALRKHPTEGWATRLVQAVPGEHGKASLLMVARLHPSGVGLGVKESAAR